MATAVALIGASGITEYEYARNLNLVSTGTKTFVKDVEQFAFLHTKAHTCREQSTTQATA